ncbi:MAG: hypothetical protein WC504_00145 [Methylobacter sp.]|jgi:hypothetical protein
MRDCGVIRGYLSSQDPENVERFIRILSAFTDDLSESDIDINRRPFTKTSEEYKQLKRVHDAALSLMRALNNCTESGVLERLSNVLGKPDLSYEWAQTSRVYSSTCYALRHQRCTSTGGRPDSLSELEKLKLRRLKSLFSRYFPNLPDNFNSVDSIIYKIGCHVLDREALGRTPDDAIRPRSISN